MNKDTCLVTGGCGFIGSHVIDELLKNNYFKKIINIDKLGVGSDINNVKSDPRIQNYYQDICHEKTKEIFETHKPGYVIHLAAESHVDRSITDPLSFVNSNVIGTGRLLECIRTEVPDARVIHVSTDEVYGHLHEDDDPFLEDTLLDPRSPYSASKAGSDLLALSYRNTYNMNVTVTRCCNNYGPRQHIEKLIPTVLSKLCSGKKIPVYGNGLNVREWIYVTDHAKALIEALFIRDPKPVYNIHGTVRYYNTELIKLIIDKLEEIDKRYYRSNNIEDYIEFVADRPGHDLCYKIATKFNDIESLTSQQSFSSGIAETIHYYKLKYEEENKTAF